MLAAQIALAAADSSAAETRSPAVVVEPERSPVQVLEFAGTVSPVFGGVEISALACGPLDDIAATALAGTGAWRC